MSDPNSSYAADTLSIEVPITFAVGAPITSIAGGTGVARAQMDGSPTAIVGSVTIDPGGARAVAAWAPGTLEPGVYTVQMRVTVSGYTETILDERWTVLRSV